jgi:hypothetical protein
VATTESDDDLIRRLQKEANDGQPTTHDPFMDLPVAKEVSVQGNEASQPGQPSCQAEGRREIKIGPTYGAPATESIRCELRAGHPGPHRARFARSRFLRRWHAQEWPNANGQQTADEPSASTDG